MLTANGSVCFSRKFVNIKTIFPGGFRYDFSCIYILFYKVIGLTAGYT